ncbi:unnamed protein product [Spirodela intermedia]|uniref:Uncharacterized protein n=1 Tax=Spirodela intermedia TaxID=51605 RepID=A0A7I8JCA4_SPIIN|nr:unnamed protein product [Spirodela intermedia]CAA6667750.1 unnamed protein product [Spirodela intermedia]
MVKTGTAMARMSTMDGEEEREPVWSFLPAPRGL